MPLKESYKVGNRNNFPNFILGKNLHDDFSIKFLLNYSKNKNIALCGWGVRDWELVLKYKKRIIKNLIEGFHNSIKLKKIKTNKYLLVQIRRSDFLKVPHFEELNFSDDVWLKSILKLCTKYSLNEVVIFSDDEINNLLINSLLNNGIKVITPITKNSDFIDHFINYVYNASLIICNASTLTISISFLFHEKIYLPSKYNDFQKVIIDEAHLSNPSLLNWN